MHIDLTPDQALLQDTSRRYLEAEMSLATLRQLDEHGGLPPAGWWRGGAELGWTSLLVGEEDGGGRVSESGLADLYVLAEELGRHVMPGPLLPVNVVAGAVSRFGTSEQRKTILPDLLSGAATAAWCFPEVASGWDVAAFETRARAEGDDIVIAGTKTPIEIGPDARTMLVTVQSDRGPTQCVVPADTPGVTITPLETVDLARRYVEVTFDDVRVANSALLGTLGDAGDAIEHQLHIAVVLQCAELAGLAARVFDFTVEYAFDRYAFGRPLVAYQALKHRFADMRLWLEAGQAIAAAALDAVDRDAVDAAEVVSAAKSYAGEQLPELVQDCVQMHGGIGVTWEHDIHLFLRRAAVNRAVFGTPTDHRERIVRLLEQRAGLESVA